VAKWRYEKTQRMKPGHGWKAKPGYQIIVADRGAVRFDVPRTWIFKLETNEKTGLTTMTLHNRPEPDDDCRLQVTHMYLPQGYDWSSVSWPELLEQAVTEPAESEPLGRSPAIHEQRRDLELAWTETRYLDAREHREARSRFCLARRGDIVVLFTLDYWPEHARRFLPVWENIMASLRLGEYIKDPQLGPGH